MIPKKLLTGRQWRWADSLILEGYRQQEVAEMLGVSMPTARLWMQPIDEHRESVRARRLLPPLETRLHEAYQWWEDNDENK